MEMHLNITPNYASQRPYQVVHLPRVGTANGIGDAHPVYTNFIHRMVDREQIDEVGAERFLRGETDFDVPGLNKLDDFDRGFRNVGHVLAVREFAQGGGAHYDVDAVDASTPRIH